jgi:hypothetical protein
MVTAVLDDWTLKEFGDPASPERTIIRKCVAPPVRPGDAAYAFLAYFTFHYEPRDAGGLPTSEDADTLVKIEEERFSELEADGLATLVAVVLQKGVKDFLFYTRDPDEFLRRASLVKDGVPQFRTGCEIVRDPAWAQYQDIP